ncbi:MAG: ectonucleotide pyrophosphatase/phosphodiesterase [Bacteroidetes bacterium]|nr:ectonucleotide pyrophosphatase/phosphodiesterase [Bacteroidota bacterium]
MAKSKLLFFLLIVVVGCNNQPSQKNSLADKPYVVMLSMDGFRWDYPEKANTPNLDSIEKIGVRADASIPCFPTKTFPNHYSIATGLYPDNHGIIFNRFFATDLAKKYAVGNRVSVRDSSFYFGEPIWVTAEKQGVKSASYFWVGSEASHENIFPTYNYAYDESVSFERRLDGVINLLKLPEKERPHLIMWYIQEPDGIGHNVGPNGQETLHMISYLDSLVGVFYNKINELPFHHKINVIITSDHGMGEISKEKTLFLDEIIDTSWVQYIDGANPVYSIEAKNEFYDTLFKKLTHTAHVQTWRKKDVPERLHFGKSKRVKDFVVVADSSWSLLVSSGKKAYSGGTHGYDNSNKDMHAIFYAYGPAFKKNYKNKAINNIDIYPLICKILDIKPAKVDGTPEKTSHMLK